MTDVFQLTVPLWKTVQTWKEKSQIRAIMSAKRGNISEEKSFFSWGLTWRPTPVIFCHHVYAIYKVFPKFLQIVGLRQTAWYAGDNYFIHVEKLEGQNFKQRIINSYYKHVHSTEPSTSLFDTGLTVGFSEKDNDSSLSGSFRWNNSVHSGFLSRHSNTNVLSSSCWWIRISSSYWWWDSESASVTFIGKLFLICSHPSDWLYSLTLITIWTWPGVTQQHPTLRKSLCYDTPLWLNSINC